MWVLYGINNCSTVKQARQWLDSHGQSYRFHDFREDGLTAVHVQTFISSVGLENLLNRRSTSWRQIPPDLQATITPETALTYLLQTPTLIKRPVLDTGQQILVGFKAEIYQSLIK